MLTDANPASMQATVEAANLLHLQRRQLKSFRMLAAGYGQRPWSLTQVGFGMHRVNLPEVLDIAHWGDTTESNVAYFQSAHSRELRLDLTVRKRLELIVHDSGAARGPLLFMCARLRSASASAQAQFHVQSLLGGYTSARKDQIRYYNSSSCIRTTTTKTLRLLGTSDGTILTVSLVTGAMLKHLI
jgi:hypothetical protein